MKYENQIIQGDCVEFMKEVPDKTFKLILTDPPYNAENIGPNARKYEGQRMKLPEEEYKAWMLSWFTEAQRIAENIVFTPGIANTNIYPQPFWQLCWHKPSAVSFNRMGGFNAWEPIFIYSKPVKGARLGQDYIRQDTMNFGKGPEKEHSCPKPLVLWEKLIQYFSNEGELIFDPFMGSGTTAVACKRLGRKYCGTDIIKKYCEISRQRLRQDVLI